MVCLGISAYSETPAPISSRVLIGHPTPEHKLEWRGSMEPITRARSESAPPSSAFKLPVGKIAAIDFPGHLWKGMRYLTIEVELQRTGEMHLQLDETRNSAKTCWMMHRYIQPGTRTFTFTLSPHPDGDLMRSPVTPGTRGWMPTEHSTITFNIVGVAGELVIYSMYLTPEKPE